MDALKREVRQLESELNGRLQEFSRIASVPGSSSSEAIDQQVDILIKKLAQVVRHMDTALEKQQQPPAVIHLVQRHRDHLFEYRKEYQRIRMSISRMESDRPFVSPSLISEHGKLNTLNSATDDILNQAYETQSSLTAQRANLQRNSQRVGGLQFASLNGIIARVQGRKKRDALILGTLIAVCIFLLFIYKS